MSRDRRRQITRNRRTTEERAADKSLAVETARQLDALRVVFLAERERTAQFQQDMLGIVGHDLLAPLGAILLGTEFLANDNERPEITSAVARIASFAKRMTRMVDQLLDMTRLRLGDGIALARSPMGLSKLVRSVIADLSVTHPGHRFELIGEDVKGIWDVDRIGQMTSNLLTNAVQYGKVGASILVNISATNGAAQITVHNELRDDPISPAALAAMFEPCHRGSDREQHRTGLGLGLYIVQEIVRAHGGTIAVESSVTGTTFQVRLPETRPVA